MVKRIVCGSVAILISCAALVSFLGCSTTLPDPSGFLGERGAMYPGAIKGIYIIDDRPTGRVSDYQSFIVDPLVVYLNPSAKAYSMPKDKLETVAKEFAQELVKALNERYSVVEQPGTGVLRIKAALTDIKANGSIGQIEKNSMLEIDFIDSSTDKRVVAFIADMQGRSFRDFTRELVARIAELQRKTKAYTVP